MTHSIILAAGKGSRLKHLTDRLPKCMINLFGKTILEWQLDTMKSIGIQDISIVKGYRSELIDFPETSCFVNYNYDTTNMLETLFCARDKLIDSVIISYGDIIYQKNVLEKIFQDESDMSIIVDKNWKNYWGARFENPLDDVESLILDEENNVLEIGQKVNSLTHICGQYIGLMKFQGNGLECVKEFYQKLKNDASEGKPSINSNLPFEKLYMTDFLNGMIKTGQTIKALPIFGGWLELDSVYDYELYNNLYSEGKLSYFFDPVC